MYIFKHFFFKILKFYNDVYLDLKLFSLVSLYNLLMSPKKDETSFKRCQDFKKHFLLVHTAPGLTLAG